MKGTTLSKHTKRKWERVRKEKEKVRRKIELVKETILIQHRIPAKFGREFFSLSRPDARLHLHITCPPRAFRRRALLLQHKPVCACVCGLVRRRD